jgi:D-alanine-D-alanine ligase
MKHELNNKERRERVLKELVGEDRVRTNRRALENAEFVREAARLVRQMRERTKFTQQDLAARLGITQSRVSEIERGESSDGVSYSLLKRVAIACGIDWRISFLQADHPYRRMATKPTVNYALPKFDRALRIGVTYDLRADYLAMGMSEEDTAEFDSEVTIAAVCSALSGMGLTPVRIGSVKRLIDKLAKGERFDAVFNFCEGLKGVAREAQVPAILDIYDIPYVFSDPLTLALALDKGMCKRVVRDAGVPTVDFRVIEKLTDVKKVDLAFPLFLKPVREGSGKGVGADSKVENARDLRRVAGSLLAKFNQPVLVEEFLPGREFTVGIVGTGDDAAVLGASEIVPIGNWVGDGYGYENKEYWQDKVQIIEADREHSRAASAVALAAWRALRCRDVGLVDIRADAAGNLHFIEADPLPSLDPRGAGLCLIAERIGLTYEALIGRIISAFIDRNPALRAEIAKAAVRSASGSAA